MCVDFATLEYKVGRVNDTHIFLVRVFDKKGWKAPPIDDWAFQNKGYTLEN